MELSRIVTCPVTLTSMFCSSQTRIGNAETWVRSARCLLTNPLTRATGFSAVSVSLTTEFILSVLGKYHGFKKKEIYNDCSVLSGWTEIKHCLSLVFSLN